MTGRPRNANEEVIHMTMTARAAALAAALMAALLVPQAAAAQTVLLLSDDFEGADLHGVRNCDITRRLPGC